MDRAKFHQGLVGTATTPPASPSAATAPIEACPICAGAGWLSRYNAADNQFTMVRCACLEASNARQAQAQRLAQSGLAAFLTHTFAAFDGDRPGLGRALARCQAYAEDPTELLLLSGGTGSGKTHLAQAIGVRAQERGSQVLFTTVPDALRNLKATFDPASEHRYTDQFDLLRNVQLLILDDLGAEQRTAWGDGELYQILNLRYEYRLATVITSNYNPADPKEAKYFNMRLASRLRDAGRCQHIHLTAADYRALPLSQRAA